MGHTKCTRDISCKNAGGEPVGGVVGQIDDLLLVLELEDHADGAKNFLPNNSHGWRDISEDGWFHKEARVSISLATNRNRRPICLAGLDEAQNPLYQH
jgi:hypothetical protein